MSESVSDYTSDLLTVRPDTYNTPTRDVTTSVCRRPQSRVSACRRRTTLTDADYDKRALLLLLLAAAAATLLLVFQFSL